MVAPLLTVRLNYSRGDFRLAVDFAVAAGLTVLFGPSGAGKSTLLDCIAGLVTPTEGEVALGTEVFYAHPDVYLPPQKRRVGYVFQRAALFPHLNVAANIAFALDRWPQAKRQARIAELAQMLRLEGLLERRAHQLSGGQAQRVALARALAPQPHLLLLDEPFNALDGELRTVLAEELKALQVRLDLPMVLVTHSRTEALSLADTVVLLQAGTIQAVGAPTVVLADPAYPPLKPTTQFSW
ncbi:ABC transporter ATP-binding protein [Anthocerotibacter panamensis]|uniref:ABC transporter ATP-binding protein n=1 Tax=Anthocerotibacter panamensis TaxID=2857077 RepID=UPI001C406DF5|nr:ABC transporter ATP-binding protein [Anthocerotibacter panamensis]